MKKRAISAILVCLMLCAMLGTPASAMGVADAADSAAPAYLYNNYFTGGTGSL